MAHKILGYQIVNDNCEIPKHLFSFVIFREWSEANIYAHEHKDEMPRDYYIQTIYDGDIEEPTYFE